MTGGFDFGPRRHPRRMSLTPMIDVVFLLLIFFMLSSRFGMDTVLPIAGGAGGSESAWQGAPRLVRIGADDLAAQEIKIQCAIFVHKTSTKKLRGTVIAYCICLRKLRH